MKKTKIKNIIAVAILIVMLSVTVVPSAFAATYASAAYSLNSPSDKWNGKNEVGGLWDLGDSTQKSFNVSITSSHSSNYLPFVALSFFRINKNLEHKMISFNQSYPLVDIKKPLIQCFIAMIFYITVTLFLVAIFKNRVYAMIVVMTYCTLEATAMPQIIGKYSIFRGAFNLPNDFSTYILPNSVIMIISTVVCLFLVFLLNYKKMH